MSTIIKVGMADYKVCERPEILTTLGLGSCVGICLYDSYTGIIGLAHIMLPFMSQSIKANNIAKFADTGIPAMWNDMKNLGVQRRSVVAKICGGSQMFAFTSQNDMMRIGERNIEATKLILSELKISIVAEDTGGKYGRTIEFYSEDGRLVIKTMGNEIKVL